MDITHCGDLLGFHERRLKPTADEEAKGVIFVIARRAWCQAPDCRKKLYYKQEHFEIGAGSWARIRPKHIASFVARLKQAKESDWVWGCHRELFTQIKVTVK